MAWKIFSIGKANARIEELEKDLAAAKALPPDNGSPALADALASNEEISKQLTQANADLATAKTSMASLNAALEKEKSNVVELTDELKAACASFKLEIKSDANAMHMITALKSSVSTTLAKLQVDAAAIPAGQPAAKPGEAVKPKLKGFELLSSAMKVQGMTTIPAK